MPEELEEKEAFLARWSRRKRAAEVPAPSMPVEAAPITHVAPIAPVAAHATPDVPAALPPFDSIGVDTDISPYLQAKVDQGLKRLALKKLFQDPHFHFSNMDKLDIYIDDYSIADPLPEGMLEQLKFAQEYIFKDPTQPEMPPEVEEASEKATPTPVTAAATALSGTAESLPDTTEGTAGREEMSHSTPANEREAT